MCLPLLRSGRDAPRRAIHVCRSSGAGATPRVAQYTLRMKTVVVVSILAFSVGRIAPVFAQAPTPTVVDSPTVKVLTGLLAPQFQEEMNFITQALGVSCATCHARGNFASDEKPEKLAARRMLEMTRAINKQNFPDHQPRPGESVLGRVTCYTCHQGERIPKLPPG
jgi:hypothetical protein